jgi:hypothetical protein
MKTYRRDTPSEPIYQERLHITGLQAPQVTNLDVIDEHRRENFGAGDLYALLLLLGAISAFINRGRKVVAERSQGRRNQVLVRQHIDSPASRADEVVDAKRAIQGHSLCRVSVTEVMQWKDNYLSTSMSTYHCQTFVVAVDGAGTPI